MMLKSVVESFFPNAKDIVRLISNDIEMNHYKKGDILIKIGDINQNMYFLQKGMLRAYFKNKNGEKITTWFKHEGQFFVSLNAYKNGVPYDVGIEAIEDLIVFSANKNFVDKMIKKHSILANIYFSEIESVFIYLQNALLSFQSNDATFRYLELLKQEPQLLARAPLSYIASYLGITQATLSRIRASVSSKKYKKE